jgi:hypothetical protein
MKITVVDKYAFYPSAGFVELLFIEIISARSNNK